MIRVKIVKRCLILTLTAILVISSLLLFACGEKEPTLSDNPVKGPTLSEKQVIDMTWAYLSSQPGQVTPEVPASYFTCARFEAAVMDAQIDFVKEYEGGKLGESFSMQFCGSSIPLTVNIAALKKLAKYDGDGLWSVYICGQWQVNEITGEVTPQDEEAIKELEYLNLTTYANKIYGYYIKYPASWSVYESGDTVEISLIPEAIIDVSVLTGGQLPASDFKLFFDNATAGLRNDVRDFQLISKSRLSDIGDDAWEIVYTGRTADGSAFIIKFRLILYKDRLYGITALATGSEFPTELESAINSFTLID